MMDVTISRVKWDGKKFPRPPFSDNPPWLNDVLSGGLLAIIPSDHDYTIWAAMTKDGVIVAEPGDRINFDPLFGLQVTKLPTNKEVWDDHDPNKKSEVVDEEKPKRKSPARKTAKKAPAKRATKKAASKTTKTAARKTTTTRKPRKAAAKKA